tara:strand:+ start:13 stop:288 length:276 start_codon:yes stop_codon:yes gene_type:complete
MKNDKVAKAWALSMAASSHNGNFRTDGYWLWSYDLVIGCTVSGEKILAEYRSRKSGEFVSMTTSTHVGKALVYCKMTVHPAFFRLSLLPRN